MYTVVWWWNYNNTFYYFCSIQSATLSNFQHHTVEAALQKITSSTQHLKPTVNGRLIFCILQPSWEQGNHVGPADDLQLSSLTESLRVISSSINTFKDVKDVFEENPYGNLYKNDFINSKKIKSNHKTQAEEPPTLSSSETVMNLNAHH